MVARFYNLPKTQHRHPWEIRATDMSKLISIKGNISKMSDIIPLCHSAKWECPACGNITNVLYRDNEFVQPKKCGCGRKGNFRLLDKEMIECIKVGLSDDLIEEFNASRNVAREKLCIIKGSDLTSHHIETKLMSSKKVILNGYLTYVQTTKGSTEFTHLFNVNSIEFIEIGWDTVPISKSEEEQFKMLPNQPNILQRLAESISDVHGYPEAKLACLLQLAGAPHIYDSNNHLVSRGTIHILLIGDPGTSKTYLARRAGSISPISSFQTAANASGKGLVAAVKQDKDIGDYVLVPGVVAMCNKGVAIIDEFDKTNKEDYGDHNNAMNDMKVPIAKATIKAVLETETSYLATANPENRVFVDYGYEGSYLNQIDMPKDSVDRFDIIYPFFSPTDEKKIGKTVDIMLNRYTPKDNANSWKPEFSHSFIRKYIASCRKANPLPEIPTDLVTPIKEKIMKLMKPRGDSQTKISYRHIECIMRFTYASAILHRRRKATQEDIDIAFGLKESSFRQLKVIDEHGYNWGVEEQVDTTAISSQKTVRNVIKELLSQLGEIIPIEEVVKKCKEKGVDEDDVDTIIEKLKGRGDFFEPRRGFISRI
jgi:DNA replicative helicase MCM subunit Mcm2 (Cdc46/Mcm family)